MIENHAYMWNRMCMRIKCWILSSKIWRSLSNIVICMPNFLEYGISVESLSQLKEIMHQYTCKIKIKGSGESSTCWTYVPYCRRVEWWVSVCQTLRVSLRAPQWWCQGHRPPLEVPPAHPQTVSAEKMTPRMKNYLKETFLCGH